jgi:DNA repair protein RadA/Sms
VAGTDRRLREAGRLGFTRAIVPRSRSAISAPAGLEVVAAASVREALEAALEAAAR